MNNNTNEANMDEQPTNKMLMTRLDSLESKVDVLHDTMTGIIGAYAFIKVLASLAVGLTIIWTGMKGWFGK